MIIKPGDTLSRIARQHKTTVNKLLELNPQITDKNKIYSGRELKLPQDVFTPPAQRNGQLNGENPAAAYPHVQFLRSQLPNVSGEMRADLENEIKNIGAASMGQLSLPERTQAVVDQVVKGLGPEERDIVTAKAYELASEGYSVEKTSGPRFAANLTMELSEYVASGARTSPELLDKMTQLYKDGQSVFTDKPELERKLAGNLIAGGQNMAARAGEVGAQNGASPADGYEHVQFLKSQLAGVPAEARADFQKEIDLIGKASQGQLQLPAQTKAVVDQVTKGMSPEERDIVTAKAHELASEGFSVEQTSGPRFAANLTMELSEYLATGPKVSPQMESAVNKLYRDGQSVFTEKPQLEQQLAANLMQGGQNQIARANGRD